MENSARQTFRKVYQNLRNQGWIAYPPHSTVYPDRIAFSTVQVRPSGDVFGRYDELHKFLKESQLTSRRQKYVDVLGKQTFNSTIEAHHLIEQRHLKWYGIDKKIGQCVALEWEDHNRITTELNRIFANKLFFDIDEVYEGHAEIYTELGLTEWRDEMKAFLREPTISKAIISAYEKGRLPGESKIDLNNTKERVFGNLSKKLGYFL